MCSTSRIEDDDTADVFDYLMIAIRGAAEHARVIAAQAATVRKAIECTSKPAISSTAAISAPRDVATRS